MAIDISALNALNVMNTINSPAMVSGASKAAGADDGQSTISAFSDILKSFMSVYSTANADQTAAVQLQQTYALGGTNNILDVIAAQQQAYASLNYASQVTNAALGAYNQIMNMQF